MGRVKTAKYSKQEIHEASKKWMKTLNTINKKPLRFTPQISNSLAKSTVSKSALRRRARKERANIAGKSMDSLAETLDAVAAEAEPVRHTGLVDPSSSLRNNKRVFDSEMSGYKKKVGLSLAEIRAQLKGN